MFVPADAAGGAAGRPDHGTGRSRAGRNDGRAGSRPRRLRRRRSCPGQRPVGKGHQSGNRVGGGKRIGRTGGQGDPDSAGGRLPLRGRNHRHQGPQAGRPSAAGEYRVGKSGGCVFEHSHERIPQPQRKRAAGVLSAGRGCRAAAGRRIAEASDRRAEAEKGTHGHGRKLLRAALPTPLGAGGVRLHQQFGRRKASAVSRLSAEDRRSHCQRTGGISDAQRPDAASRAALRAHCRK